MQGEHVQHHNSVPFYILTRTPGGIEEQNVIGLLVLAECLFLLGTFGVVFVSSAEEGCVYSTQPSSL